MTRSIAIVGGGATGVLLALHLLRQRGGAVRITLVEPRAELGRGLAYATQLDDHVLNVAAGNMGAYADDPEHFWRWLCERGLAAGSHFAFVPRRHFGAYLADLLARDADDRLRVVRSRAIDVDAEGVRLADGRVVAADAVVLATGHDVRPTPALPDPAAPVLIIGSGLSAVDQWLALAAAGHRGPVTMASRHGLLPLRHHEVERIALAGVPLGRGPRDLMRWLRDAARASPTDWRAVIDGLRPCNQRIWQHWPDAERRRFLRHARPYWNIHRHRLPAPIDDRLSEARAAGRLVVRSTLRHGWPDPAGFDATYDCTGLALDLERTSNRLLQSLLRRGAIRPDPLHIGIDVDPDCAVLDRAGRPSPSLFAAGPLTRGRLFEIEAVPDIRVQVAALAEHLTAPLPSLRIAGAWPSLVPGLAPPR